MLQRDGHGDRGYAGLRITLARAPGHCRRRNQLHDCSQGRPFQNGGAVRHLHLAGDVQIMTGIRLRQIPTVFGQGREHGYCKEKQREQRASHNRHKTVSRA
jgi:hypothetical protein